MLVSPKTRKLLTWVATITLLPVAILNAQLDLERAWRVSQTTRFEELTLPPAPVARALSLNYNTLAADIMWLVLTVQHGEFVRFQSRASDNVLINAFQLARTDPFFYEVYHWATGAFLNRRYPISDQDLHDVADLVEFGTDHMLTDAELRKSLGLLFVGYGKGFSDEQLIRQSKRALEALDEAVKLSPDDAELVRVRSFFRHRIERYGGKSDSAERALDEKFWFSLYMSTQNDRVREDAARQLRRMDAFDRLVKRDEAQLRAAHLAEKPYLPMELWLLIDPQRGGSRE